MERGDPTDQTIKKEMQSLVAKLTSFHEQHIFEAALPHNMGHMISHSPKSFHFMFLLGNLKSSKGNFITYQNTAVLVLVLDLKF